MVFQPSGQTNTGFAADKIGDYPTLRVPASTLHSQKDYIRPRMAVQGSAAIPSGTATFAL
jgi:hypothetical protein